MPCAVLALRFAGMLFAVLSSAHAAPTHDHKRYPPPQRPDTSGWTFVNGYDPSTSIPKTNNDNVAFIPPGLAPVHLPGKGRDLLAYRAPADAGYRHVTAAEVYETSVKHSGYHGTLTVPRDEEKDSCTRVMVFRLPSSIFTDAYQLSELQRLDGVETVTYPPTLDLELPQPVSPPSTLVVFMSKDKAQDIPFHFRYHPPMNGTSHATTTTTTITNTTGFEDYRYVRVQVPPAFVMASCPPHAAWYPGQQSWHQQFWRLENNVNMVNANPSYFAVPVGRESDLGLVTAGSVLTSVLAAVMVVCAVRGAVFRTRVKND